MHSIQPFKLSSSTLLITMCTNHSISSFNWETGWFWALGHETDHTQHSEEHSASYSRKYTHVTQQDVEPQCICAHTHTHTLYVFSVKLSASISTQGRRWNRRGRCANTPDWVPTPPTSTHHKWVIKKTPTQSHTIIEEGFIYPVHRWSVLCRCKHKQHNEVAEVNIDQWEAAEMPLSL